MSARTSAYLVLWRYRAEAGKESKLVQFFSKGGPWAQLHAASKDWLGIELLADDERPGEFVSIERWKSEEGASAFAGEHEADLDRLDRQIEKLTGSEQRIGAFVPPEIP
ncbi:MAG TPA: hypothetical protein PLD37_13020 [Usitatibacteraceae bacterium]|mgnify:CR=1 FL=1|nr:hypothetical protein [Usitatibacteraceae bacterium]